MFGEPEETGGAQIKPRDVIGHLLLVWATDYVAYSPTINTKEGQRADLVVVDAVDLDQVDPETGAGGLITRRNWWRPGQLVDGLRKRVGNPDPVLVRIAKGTSTRGIPPFVLNSATGDPQAVTRATAWIQAHPDFKPSEAGGGPQNAEPDSEPVQQQPLLDNATFAPRPVTPAEQSVLERLARQAQQPLPPNRPVQDDPAPF